MKHAFVICAYGNSPYLEECIISLKQQTLQSELVLTTSTPNSDVEQLCKKYDIQYKVRQGKPGIAEDWNFAFESTTACYVTIAHQDDVYYKDYAKDVVERMDNSENPLIAFTDYVERKNDVDCVKEINLRIKRMLLAPMKKVRRSDARFWKRHIIRFGNAISCPTVTYQRALIVEYVRQARRPALFLKHFRSNLDWQTWEWLSKKQGQFLYVPKVLMAHRIHEDSETSATIKDKQRRAEDYEMFCHFWPKWIAGLLAGWYGKSEEGNQLEKNK